MLLNAMALATVSCDLHAQQRVALKNVNVIDGMGSPAQADRPVIIAGDHVQSITSRKQPAMTNPKVLDMRLHCHEEPEEDFDGSPMIQR